VEALVSAAKDGVRLIGSLSIRRFVRVRPVDGLLPVSVSAWSPHRRAEFDDRRR
jgi:hypothetical protein